MLDNLTAAREQMALSLGFHIVFAVLGVGLPWLLLFVEDRAIRTGDQTWMRLARTWAKATAVLFAVGAVSGTVLSFEFGLLWPTFMQRFGSAFGISFTLEAFAFFIEAVFLGLYLYGWDRLSPRAHRWCGVPVQPRRRVLSAQDCVLVAENQDLHVFGCAGTGEECQPAGHAAEHEVEQAQRHAS